VARRDFIFPDALFKAPVPCAMIVFYGN